MGEPEAQEWDFSSLGELHDRFGWEEYLVVTATLLISLLMGIYFAWRGQHTTHKYLHGSKKLTMFPITMSLACRLDSR